MSGFWHQCINVYFVTTCTFVLNWKSKQHGEEESSDYVIWYWWPKEKQPIGCYFCNWWCECFMTIYLSFMNVENLLKI